MSMVGSALREARGRRPQKDVVDKIEGLRQSTLSRWESGVLIPTEAELKKICLVLDVSFENLNALAATDRDLARFGSSSEEDFYLQEQQLYIARMGPTNMRVWLVGPRLPVATSPKVRAIWTTNLDRGVTYCILWFIESIDELSLSAFARAAEEIATNVLGGGRRYQGVVPREPVAKRINHYVVGRRSDGRMKLYDRLQARLASSRAARLNVFHDPTDETAVGSRLAREFVSPFGSLVLYQPHAAGTGQQDEGGHLLELGLAAITLNDVRPQRSEPPRTVYFFAGDERSKQLVDLVDDFLNEPGAATGNTRPARGGGKSGRSRT